MDKWVKRTVLIVVSLNLLQLFVYPQSWTKLAWPSGFGGEKAAVKLEEPGLKKWVAIPSFMPWILDRELEDWTCEAYFGHGYKEEITLLRVPRRSKRLNDSGDPNRLAGSFSCKFCPTLRTSICEGKQIIMNLDRIEMFKGGEYLETVIRRDEDAELPHFVPGAFQVRVTSDSALPPGVRVMEDDQVEKLMPQGKVITHTLRNLLRTVHTVEATGVRCARTIAEPTVVVTRFEYANLFYTHTDWFSAYSTSRVTGLKMRPRIVFLDGHRKSPLDDGWEAMFSAVTYAKHFTGPVCFDHLIFAPLGYDVALFKHITSALDCEGQSVNNLTAHPDPRKTSRLREFGEFLAASFGPLSAVQPSNNSMEVPSVTVLMVRREDYLAHSRRSDNSEERLAKELEVLEVLKNWARERSSSYFENNKLLLNVSVINGMLAHMTLEQQMKAVREADVLVGAHGAGLTHLLSAKATAAVLEISFPNHSRPHFQTLSHWQGREYHVIKMDGMDGDRNQVREVMEQILNNMFRRKPDSNVKNIPGGV